MLLEGYAKKTETLTSPMDPIYVPNYQLPQYGPMPEVPLYQELMNGFWDDTPFWATLPQASPITQAGQNGGWQNIYKNTSPGGAGPVASRSPDTPILKDSETTASGQDGLFDNTPILSSASPLGGDMALWALLGVAALAYFMKKKKGKK